MMDDMIDDGSKGQREGGLVDSLDWRNGCRKSPRRPYDMTIMISNRVHWGVIVVN